MSGEQPAAPPVLVDQAAKEDSAASSAGVELPASADGTSSPSSRPLNQHIPATSSPLASPPQSPPVSPPVEADREDYYSSRPRHDRFGNPIPEGRRQNAMSSVYGNRKIRLPGDLGARDPRRPKSPAPNFLPGDLGPNDPRRASSRPTSSAGSPAPSATSGHGRHASDEVATRLEEDPPEPGNRQDSDSDADADADNDNDTDGDDSKRGRAMKRPVPGRTTSGKAINVRDESSPDSEREQNDSSTSASAKPDPTKGQSRLSFAKDKRKTRLTSSSPSGKRRVHPSTAYDAAPSGTSTPLQSDDESASELRAAQKLSLSMSGIHSTPSAHRVIRQILRGDFEHFQREAEDGRKRQRMYLVATDISPEAEYALEWTIGTVLRDGDTLFAVYAADEDTVGDDGGVQLGHGAESVRDTASILKSMPTTIQHQSNTAGPSPLARSSLGGDTRSRSRGVYSSADAERRKAVETITERCVRLLRKTRLQVRVVVEVFHCKSPRHMVTEVIDFLSPTLVIIGSRGQSAVKGVLLGSFSNYLVTKSSVPVMVARKKLRKHSKTAAKRHKDGLDIAYQNTGRGGRFSNVIQAPKGKGLRVESWDKVGID
ncbi:Putative universal stress protein A family [Septoria linicola]|uniref:Universal stress protein A family n=1 Tax=Septoria linicola TaxID=215465 RepID=A0A9Q9AUF8_9PEZI|nr:putative universal stress protein A family [Septoria linicola]USW52333.1 Putative universal stress protein A family [Septoria linicola]